MPLGVQPKHIEGYTQADWLLMDYVDFVVHIFSESARKFYDLERLWKSAKRLQLADLEKPERKSAARKTAAKRTTQAQDCGQTPTKHAPQAQLGPARPQEVIAGETSHRMDRQDPQLADPVPDRRICEAAFTLRRAVMRRN